MFNQDFYDKLIEKLGEDYKHTCNDDDIIDDYEDTDDDDDDVIDDYEDTDDDDDDVVVDYEDTDDDDDDVVVDYEDTDDDDDYVVVDYEDTDDDDDYVVVGYNYKYIPLSRVKSDRDSCINHISEIFNKSTDISEMEIALTMYSNFYIRYGMAGRFQAENLSTEYDGLELIFNNLSEHKEHLMRVYKAAKYQNDYEWYRILDNNPNSIVAKLYIFVKLCNEYGCVAAEHSQNIEVDTYEEMWLLYESLSPDAQKYVLAKNCSNTNQLISPSLLPYISFKSLKEYLNEYILMYYENILETLNIPLDVEPENAFSQIFDALGLQEIIELQKNFINKNRLILQEFTPEKHQSNLNDETSKSKNSEIIPQFLEFSYNTITTVLKFLNQMRKVQFDLTFIAEKLQYLLNDDFNTSWVNSSDLLKKCSWNKMSIIERCTYLHIPVVVPIDISLFESHFETYKKNQKIKRNAKQKKEMMDYYAHSWKHISYPSIVQDIAKELEKTNQSLSNRLMKVYNSERTLQMGIQLLQYISSDNEAKVSEEFKNSMSIPNFDDKHTLSLEQVINDSLDIVVFKILMSESDDSKSIQNCRNKWNKHQSLELLSQDYTEKYISNSNNTQKIIDWVSENFFNITKNINDSWNSVRFIKDRFAVNQFKEILVEIFTNAFLHGKEYMNLNFTSNSKELIIETENPSEGFSNTQSGLSTLENLLDHLNYGTNIKSLSCINDNPFKLTIRLNKKLMIVRCL